MEQPQACTNVRINKNPGGVLLAVVLLLVLSGLVWWVYTPGLTGGFIFDDEANLKPMARFGGVQDLSTLLAFLSSAELPGRPLRLLSFLIDGNDWPLDTHRLKVTGLKIHLLAAVWVCWLTY